MKSKLFIVAPTGTYSGTYSGKAPEETISQTGQMGAGLAYGEPGKVQSAADSK